MASLLPNPSFRDFKTFSQTLTSDPPSFHRFLSYINQASAKDLRDHLPSICQWQALFLTVICDPPELEVASAFARSGGAGNANDNHQKKFRESFGLEFLLKLVGPGDCYPLAFPIGSLGSVVSREAGRWVGGGGDSVGGVWVSSVVSREAGGWVGSGDSLGRVWLGAVGVYCGMIPVPYFGKILGGWIIGKRGM